MTIDRRLKVRVSYIDHGPDINPFDLCPLRELARRTGQDPSNLSKYHTGKLVLSEPLYWELLNAADAWGEEQTTKRAASQPNQDRR